jgi:hypothetical protein
MIESMSEPGPAPHGAAPSEVAECESTGDPRLDALLERFERDAAELGEIDLAPLVRLGGPSTGLLAAGRRVERIRRRLQAFDTAYVTALEQGDEPARNGCPSTATFLKAQLRLSPGEAKARVTAAHACAVRTEFAAGLRPPERPVLAAARAGGAVSAEHSAVILAALTQVPARTAPEDLEAAEVCLVDQAMTFDPAGVAVLGRQILANIDPDGTLRDHEWKQRVRSASLTRNHDGTGTLRARLTPEALEVWQTVLDPLAKPQPTSADGPDRRSAEQRLHDAVHDAGTRLLDCGDLPASGGTPATVVIHLTQEQYAAQLALAEASATDDGAAPEDGPGPGAGPGAGSAGLAETEHGALLPIGSALRMADQAVVCTLVTDAKGVPLQLGRTSRIASPGQTIALAARDRGCTMPGCDRPAAWTQRHHIVPWQCGGATDLDNLALLCGYHHRTFEALGWQCVMLDGRPHWIPPAWIDPERKPIRNTVHDRHHARAGP